VRPIPTPEPPVNEQVIAFVKSKAAEARTAQRSRLASAVTWREGTDADWRAGKVFGEQMAGREFKPSPSDSKAGRESNAQIDERIAAKHAREAEMYEQVEALLLQRAQEIATLRAEEQIAFPSARVCRAPQVEPTCDKVCQDCGLIFTIGELEREDRAVWGHPCRDSKGWSNPIDEPSSGRERRCESFRAPVQPARAPQPEQEKS
jgi:hypothetical protein